MNETEFEFLGITKFHEKGYTGKNVTIASKESILKNTFDDVECSDYFTIKSKSAKHGTNVMDYIRQIVPNARKIACSSTGSTVNDIWINPDFEKLLENPPQVYTGSAFGTSDSKESHMVKYKALRDKGCLMCFGAGNEAESGCLNITKNDVFKAIAAYKLTNGQPKRETFSSIGEEVDFASLDNLKATWTGARNKGTSFSSPIFASMVALVQDFFIAKTGKQLPLDKLLQFIKDNCIDVESEGLDTKSGYGLFILPDPDCIEISKYTDIEERNDDNMVTYKDLNDIPDWGKETIQKLINKNALKGDENGNLNISNDLLRTLVIHDRLGLYK